MKKNIQSFPWLPVSIGILGLVVGYTVVLVETQPDLFAHQQLRCKATGCTGSHCIQEPAA